MREGGKEGGREGGGYGEKEGREGKERKAASRERKAGEGEHEGKRNIQLPMGLEWKMKCHNTKLILEQVSE